MQDFVSGFRWFIRGYDFVLPFIQAAMMLREHRYYCFLRKEDGSFFSQMVWLLGPVPMFNEMSMIPQGMNIWLEAKQEYKSLEQVVLMACKIAEPKPVEYATLNDMADPLVSTSASRKAAGERIKHPGMKLKKL